jgi:hypothetical protein
MRIVVADAAGAGVLAERLAAVFGARRISEWDGRPDVGVRVGRHSDRAVLRVLDTVDGWLDQTGTGFADMRLGDRSYRIAKRAPVESWQHLGSDPAALDEPGATDSGATATDTRASLTNGSSSSAGRKRR